MVIKLSKLSSSFSFGERMSPTGVKFGHFFYRIPFKSTTIIGINREIKPLSHQSLKQAVFSKIFFFPFAS